MNIPENLSQLLTDAAQAYWAGELEDMTIRFDEREDGILYVHGDNQDHNGLDREFVWAPHRESYDALPLAVKLGICIEPYPIYEPVKHSVICKQRRRSDQLRGHNPTEVVELYRDSDPDTATCLAITRCAAAIGKSQSPA